MNLVINRAVYALVENGQHVYRRLRKIRYMHKNQSN